MAQIIFPKFFTPRLATNNLRGSSLNVVPRPYNSLNMHNSSLYMIAHIGNHSSLIPDVAKSSTTLAQFRARLNSVKFTGYQCMNCSYFYLFLHFYSHLNGVEFAGCQCTHELYLPTEICNIRTRFLHEYCILYSEFILAHIVILISNVNCK